MSEAYQGLCIIATWWYMPLTPALDGYGQDNQEFKASLGHMRQTLPQTKVLHVQDWSYLLKLFACIEVCAYSLAILWMYRGLHDS